MNLPKEYLSNMCEILKDEYDEYLNSFNSNKVSGLKVNTLKIKPEELINKLNLKEDKIPWAPTSFYIEDNSIYSKHPYYYCGLYYLQDPSAMIPSEVLPIKEGDAVLDCCAAPGGKTIRLAARLNNTGILVANDISTSRCIPLVKTIRRAGVSNTIVTAIDLNELAKDSSFKFDSILLDGPCSGEGMFRKEPSLINSWLKDHDSYPAIQKQLISSAISLLKEGGYLVYSTCTFNPNENEEVIKYALDNYDVEVKKIDLDFEGLTNGIGVKEAIRLYPHKIKGEGHFVCLLQKKGSSILNKSYKFKDIDIKDASEFTKYLDTANKHYEIINDNLYLVPNYNFNINKYHILNSGLHVGEYSKYGFKPSQALAYYLTDFKSKINLDSNSIECLKYLKGETIDNKNNLKGSVLVQIDGYSIGWAKASDNKLKNLLDKSYRIL